MRVTPVAYKIEQSVMGQKMCFSDSYVIFGVQRENVNISTRDVKRSSNFRTSILKFEFEFDLRHSVFEAQIEI